VLNVAAAALVPVGLKVSVSAPVAASFNVFAVKLIAFPFLAVMTRLLPLSEAVKLAFALI
jgi:hypothetical protein